MIAAAPPGLQNITAQLELLMTVAMMSRITISLKSSVEEMKNVDVVRPVLPSMFTQHSRLNVASDIKIIAPGFNQTRTVDSLDFGLEMSTHELRQNQPSRLGLGNGALTTLTPNRRKLSTIQQESPDLEHGLDSASNSTTSPRGSAATYVGDAVGLNTIEEKPRGV